MIAAAAIVWGIWLARLTGGKLMRLSSAEVHHAGWIAILFVAQGVLRGRFSSPTDAVVMAVAGWAVCCLILLALLIRSRAEPGIPLLTFGVALNLLVVLANDGMPYVIEGVAVPQHSNFYHLAGRATELVFLADVLPLPEYAALLSLGDLLLFVGLVVFMVARSSKSEGGAEVTR